jgi:hypothetical protein
LFSFKIELLGLRYPPPDENGWSQHAKAFSDLVRLPKKDFDDNIVKVKEINKKLDSRLRKNILQCIFANHPELGLYNPDNHFGPRDYYLFWHAHKYPNCQCLDNIISFEINNNRNNNNNNNPPKNSMFLICYYFILF